MQMLPERRTVGALLAHLAQAMPQQEAVVWLPQRLTYAALYAQATAVAGGLWRLGIRPGEPVALLMSNRPEWITVAFGCALIGAPVVALSTWSRRVELEYVLDHSQAVALVTLDGFLGADYQALLIDIVPEVAQHLPGQIGATRLPTLRELIVLGRPALGAARGFDEVLALGRSLDPAVVRAASARVQPTDILYVLYTSGSTARPTGEVGEILVAGYVTPGYDRDPKNNARAFDAEGYFHTGDLGMLNAEGRLYFRGRLQELIKSGGINISPLEVEAYLMTYPKVQYAAVVGLPDTTKGEVPAVAVQLREGETASAEEIRGFCRNHIASYKIPVHVVFLHADEFPRTSTGKVQKTALREVIAGHLQSSSGALIHREGSG
jgi:acyl-CoA synthetase (AMP-forming)/AMP-acid ligase II